MLKLMCKKIFIILGSKIFCLSKHVKNYINVNTLALETAISPSTLNSDLKLNFSHQNEMLFGNILKFYSSCYFFKGSFNFIVLFLIPLKFLS